MSAQPPNFPQMQQPPPVRKTQTAVRVIDASTARVLSAAAHGAIAFGLFGIGFLISLAISGVIWLYGRRNREVRFHSEQAGCYQCSVVLINLAIISFVGTGVGLSFFQASQGRSDFGVGGVAVVGIVLFVLWFFGTIAFGIYGAVMVLLGKEFKYPIIGARAEREAREAIREG